MSKIYSVLTGLGLSVLALTARPALAQTLPPHRTCGTQEANDEQQRELMKRIPGYDPTPRATTAPSALRTTAGITYTLPVVVHVIHNGELKGSGSNLSQAQVQSQIDVLNEDYRNLNADGALTPSVYQSRRGDAQIQFVVAKIDPSGNTMPEPGIDRVNRNGKGWTAPPYSRPYIESTIKPATSWDPAQYVNIWVMNFGPNLLGYAQFPDNNAQLGGLNTFGGAANTDGVVILYNAFGRVGNVAAPYNKGRTLTHELGHWLGLRHIWGDSNCGNDYCNDTPTQAAYNYGCPTFPQVTCNNVTGDMSMNYMDYSDDACTYMFSNDQVSRIQAVMVNTPRRTTLASSTVGGGCVGNVVATVPATTQACAGGTLTLTANGPTGATYNWTGPNGFTSTQQTPTLPNATAAMAGTYTVVIATATQCPTPFTTSVIVNDVPTISSSATAALCPGSNATLTVTNPSPNAVYSWSVVSGDGLTGTPTSASVTVKPTVPSVYRVSATFAGAGGCILSATVAVAVLPTPVLTATSSTVVLGNTTTLSATNLAGIPNLTYNWSLVNKDGTLTSLANTPTLNVQPTRSSVYQLTVTSANGCSTSARSTVGVTVSQWYASAFPVPFGANGMSVRVETNDTAPIHVLMYDVMGRKVLDQDVANAEKGRNDIALPGTGALQAGRYVVIVQQPGQEARLNVLRDSN